jgi:molybdate transport system ATP-binding protein
MARPRLTPPLLRLTNVDLFVEYHPVLRGLNWQLRDGEHWAVFGANGSGKSSFLRLLYGDLAPALGGTVERRGHARGASIDEWKRRIGFVSPQLQTDYDVNVSVLDLVASGRHASIGLALPATQQDRRAARRWLKFVGLGAFARNLPCELSYGELRRALLARALAADARLLLFDEPVTGLDPEQREFMKRVMEDLMKRRRTVIMAVHHADDLPRGITHALHLHKRQGFSSDFHSGT